MADCIIRNNVPNSTPLQLHRKMAIYLMKKNSWATNRQIGQMFGGISYSAVSKTYERFREAISGNASIRKKLAKIESRLSHVKG